MLADGESSDMMTLELTSGENLLILDLKTTSDLLASTYDDPQLQSRQGKLADLGCEWQGVVRGLEDESMVAISVCPVIRGIVAVEGVELLLEAAPGTTSPQGLHQIILNPPEGSSAGKCGVSSRENNMDNEALNDDSRATNSHRTSRERRRAYYGQHGPLWTKKDTLYIEFVLVVDYSFYKHFKHDVYDRCRAIVNIVNAMYRKIGVVVVLTDIEVWNNGDQISVTEDYNHTLTLFSTYREGLLRSKPYINNDNSMLITTVDFIGTTVGYAHVSGICSYTRSVGVVQDKKRDAVGTVAQTMAHEMGHNLGMDHDITGCSCATGRCIMGETSSSMFKPNIAWSSCSKEVIRQEMDSLRYECLKNVPSSYYVADGKACGNGVLDEGEQCDCGPSDLCHNRCCIAKTCKLAVNATCATGSCCNIETCHPHEAGRHCRKNGGQCDLPEFCSGHSEYCPVDVHTRDGIPCDGGKGYCYQGSCGSSDARCKRLWGANALHSDQSCRELNERGDQSGNCGWVDSSRNVLKKCSESSSDCGTLFCNAPSQQDATIKGSFQYGWYRRRGHCNHVLGVERLPEYFWLVLDGSPCGREKDMMCVNQQCKAIEQPNGVTECPKNCSNHGVCNSKGNCHCDPGYGSLDCASEGHGGSIDSNYIKNFRDGDVVAEGILIFLAIIIPMIAIICCSWEKIRRCWELKGYSSMKDSCPCCAECLNICCCPMMSKFTNWFVTVKPLKKERNDNNTKKEIQQVVDSADAATICQVSLAMKEESKTNSWGVADERLFTEVYKITPKNSPDLSRKIMLPMNSTVYHHVSTDALDRTPTYQHQSISVDSGCVSDEDVSVQRPLSSQMSMTSLIGALSRFGHKSVKPGSTREINQRSKAFGSQKSIPLSRYVVDPLAGNRSSRHGTPPPDNIRYSFSRSVSTDATSASRVHRQGPMQPPSSALKPHKSDDNLHSISSQPKKRWPLFGKNTNSGETSKSNQGSQEDLDDQQRKPMLPPQQGGNDAPTRSYISRAAPPPPPPPNISRSEPPPQPPPPSKKKKPQEERPSAKSTEGDWKKNTDATASCSSSKKPIMPPNFSLKSSSTSESPSPKRTPPTVSSKGGPIFPSKSKPVTVPPSNSSVPLKKRQFEAKADPKASPAESGKLNVKALARRLEQE